MTRRLLLASLIAAALPAGHINAATILRLVIDPVTTAGAGIPLAGGFPVTSTQSGALRWQLFALDDNAASLGISSYDIRVGGATSSLHRSPMTTWYDADEETYNAGFSLLRTANNSPLGVFQAAQPLPGMTPVLITGFGQTASNFTVEIPQAASIFPPPITVSGQWGNYATISPALGKKWLFIGEGAYASGVLPSLSPAEQVITHYGFGGGIVSEVVIAPSCFGSCPPPTLPLVVDDLDLGNVTRGSIITATLPSTSVFIWSLESFTGPAGTVTGAAVDPNTGLFSWNSAGAPLGMYSAVIGGSHPKSSGVEDTGTLTFTLVPEPATLSLFGLAMIGVLGRRR